MVDINYAPVRLRRDAIYLKTEDGIFFRGPKGSFALKGKSIYTTFHALVPFMDGRVNRETILDAVRYDQRKSVADLLNLLIDRSIVYPVDLDDAGTLEPAVAKAFAPQLDFIAHFADRPETRFAAFRYRKMLLLGDGASSFMSAGLALLKNGLHTLHVDASAGHEHAVDRFMTECVRLAGEGLESHVRRVVHQAGLASERFDLVIYCADRPDLPLMAALNYNARLADFAFFPAMILEGKSYIGPWTSPFVAGCWLCTMLRWTDNAESHAAQRFWKYLAIDTGIVKAAEELSDILVRMLGNTVALEAFRLCIGEPGPETRRRVLTQDHASLETSVIPFLPHGDCPACRSLPFADTSAEDVLRSATPDIKRACLDTWMPLIGNAFGVFNHFSDESLEQIPLRLSSLNILDAQASGGPATMFGWSLENSNDARCRALFEAVADKAVRHADGALQALALDHNDAQAAGVETIVGWLGTSAHAAPARYKLMATDYLTGQKRLLPAGAVHADFDVEHYFDGHAFGVGVGHTIEDAIREALLSSARYIALGKLVDRTLEMKRFHLSCAQEDATTRYLLAAARHLGEPDISMGVAEVLPGVFAALVLPPPNEHVAIEAVVLATDLSVIGAMNRAMMQAVAFMQLRKINTGAPPHRGLGLLTGARIAIEPEGGHVDQADEEPATVERIVQLMESRDDRLLWIDITPSDVAETRTLHVVKALIAHFS
jgi:bacteriocin biosynthesis cyclodehydratase domain-containing protein